VSPATGHEPQRILLIEDDSGVRRALHLMLCAHGYDVHAHECVWLLLADPSVAGAAFLVADYQLADGNGIDVFRALRTAGWAGRAVLVTGAASPALRAKALAAGYATVLEKPLHAHDVLQALEST
jgi:ActR/RegA family two-component response regulator